MQARGRLDVRKGEGMQRPLQSAEADSFPPRGSRDCGLVIKRLLKRKCLNVVRLPLITLLCKELPPQGEAYEIE